MTDKLIQAGDALFELLENALGVHIYDYDQGEGPDEGETCPYEEALAAWTAAKAAPCNTPQLADDERAELLKLRALVDVILDMGTDSDGDTILGGDENGYCKLVDQLGQARGREPLEHKVDCGQCEGTGTTDAMGHDEECPVCDGSGKIDAEED